MTKLEFKEVMDILTGAYYLFQQDEHQMDTWYRFLGGYDKSILEEVVTEYVKEVAKAPSISDFYSKCEKRSKLREIIAEAENE